WGARVSAPALRPLTIGEILDGAFTVYRRHFIVLFTTVALLLAPMELIAAMAPGVVGGVVTFAWSAVMDAPLVIQASTAILGGTPGIVDAIRAGIRRMPAVLGVSILVTLLTALATAPFAILVLLYAGIRLPTFSGGGAEAIEVVLVVTLGAALILLPG